MTKRKYTKRCLVKSHDGPVVVYARSSWRDENPPPRSAFLWHQGRWWVPSDEDPAQFNDDECAHFKAVPSGAPGLP